MNNTCGTCEEGKDPVELEDIVMLMCREHKSRHRNCKVLKKFTCDHHTPKEEKAIFYPDDCDHHRLTPPTAGHEPGGMEKVISESAIEVKEYVDRRIGEIEEPYLGNIEFIIRKHFTKTPTLAAENEKLRTELELLRQHCGNVAASVGLAMAVSQLEGGRVTGMLLQIAESLRNISALTEGGDDGK